MRQARAVLILAQVCSALTAAHAKGIVHRDLKPENILLVQEPEELGKERAKVLDFGIAKILDVGKGGAAGGEDPPSYVTKTALTRVGTIVGTPAYMSPEQCRGGDIDGRSDIYACGVLLYQLVTGELPFSGETPLHTAMRHIHAQPRNPAELRRGLAPAIERTILKALAKWPGERQQTAEQLREELYAAFPTLPDRGDIVLPTPVKGNKPTTAGGARTESARPPQAEEVRTQAITTGGLGSTPLRGVRLHRAAEPLPTERTLPDQQQTERDNPRTKDARAEEDDDEPRTFLIPADSVIGGEPSRHSTAPQTQMPATQMPPTQMPSTDKLAPQPSKPLLAAQKAAVRSEPAPRPPAAKTTTRGVAAKPEPERRPAPTAISTTPRQKAHSAPAARPAPAELRPSESAAPTNTETGLTPTALTNLPHSPPPPVADVAKTERGTAPDMDPFPSAGSPEVDDDEPATFIREPGPGSTPHVKTLVMDEPHKAPQPQSHVGPILNPALANTVAQPAALLPVAVAPQAHAHAPQPHAQQQQQASPAMPQQQAAPAQQVLQQQAVPLQQAMPQQMHPAPNQQAWDPSRNTGFAPNGGAPSQSGSNYPAASYAAMSNTARLAEEPNEPQVKSTVRMNPQETVAKAAAAAMRADRALGPIGTGWNESTVARRRAAPARSGLIGQIDALSGSTGMLIGIGLGLALAAVGLLLAVLILN